MPKLTEYSGSTKLLEVKELQAILLQALKTPGTKITMDGGMHADKHRDLVVTEVVEGLNVLKGDGRENFRQGKELERWLMSETAGKSVMQWTIATKDPVLMQLLEQKKFTPGKSVKEVLENNEIETLERKFGQSSIAKTNQTLGLALKTPGTIVTLSSDHDGKHYSKTYIATATGKDNIYVTQDKKGKPTILRLSGVKGEARYFLGQRISATVSVTTDNPALKEQLSSGLKLKARNTPEIVEADQKEITIPLNLRPLAQISDDAPLPAASAPSPQVEVKAEAYIMPRLPEAQAVPNSAKTLVTPVTPKFFSAQNEMHVINGLMQLATSKALDDHKDKKGHWDRKKSEALDKRWSQIPDTEPFKLKSQMWAIIEDSQKSLDKKSPNYLTNLNKFNSKMYNLISDHIRKDHATPAMDDADKREIYVNNLVAAITVSPTHKAVTDARGTPVVPNAGPEGTLSGRRALTMLPPALSEALTVKSDHGFKPT